MSSFFRKPKPQQAVPGDLAGGRQAIINAIFGTGGGGGGGGLDPRYAFDAKQKRAGFTTNGTGGGPQNNVLQQLLGLTGGATEQADINALRTSSNQNLQDNINAQNADSPGRFSTANAYQNSQLTERSNNDFNTMVSQLQQRNRDRQLQAIMGLLGPVLSPTFGGPFTQGSSGFDNFLGLLNTASNFSPGGAKKAAGNAAMFLGGNRV